MTTVEDVAGELDRTAAEVLDACRALGIVASSAASGLSADEHRRLRAALHAGPGLPPVVAGSTEHEPGAPPPPDPRSLRARSEELRAAVRKPRLSPRAVSRIGIYVFLIVAVIVSVVALQDRADDEVERPLVQAYGADDVGTCVDLLEADGRSQLRAVPCAEPHDAELYEVADAGDGDAALPTGAGAPYPGADALTAVAGDACGARFAEYVGRPHADSALEVVFLVPTAETWALGDRAVLCLVEDPTARLVGSVSGSSR